MNSFYSNHHGNFCLTVWGYSVSSHQVTDHGRTLLKFASALFVFALATWCTGFSNNLERSLHRPQFNECIWHISLQREETAPAGGPHPHPTCTASHWSFFSVLKSAPCRHAIWPLIDCLHEGNALCVKGIPYGDIRSV